MKTVKSYIESKQHQFENHPFFTWLTQTATETEVAQVLPSLTFWVASFQDILALNEKQVVDPQMREIAKHHRKEDSGHDRWFFDDLARMGVAEPTTRELFSKRHAAVRHASFQLISEVYRASDDVCRIALLLTLESTGHVFFEQTARWQERFENASGLKYFSRYHIEVEKNHAMFEEKLDAYLDALDLTLPVRAEAIAIVDRCYVAFMAMFDSLMVVRKQPQPMAMENSAA